MEKKYIDLHSHTLYSDGSLTPTQLIMMQVNNGIELTAISDHDNCRAYREGKAAAEKYGIELLTGVELTTPRYHLLALNFDQDNKEFQDFVNYSEKLQVVRTDHKITGLREKGIPLTRKYLEQEFPNSRIGSGHLREILSLNPEIKSLLQKRHPEKTAYEVYSHYLGERGLIKEMESKPGVDEKEAIDAVHAAGGIIGIAHPVKDVEDMRELEALLRQGIDFLEIQPNLNGRYNQKPFEDFAKSNNLPISYGSDYHGPRMERPSFKRGSNILTKGMEALLSRELVC